VNKKTWEVRSDPADRKAMKSVLRLLGGQETEADVLKLGLLYLHRALEQLRRDERAR
jgi:hypothetical protein